MSGPPTPGGPAGAPARAGAAPTATAVPADGRRSRPTVAHGDRGAVEPGTQLALSLLLSLALWIPSMLATFSGDLEMTAAAIRYLIAFIGCRFAISGIASLLTSYRHHLDPAPSVARRRADHQREPVAAEHAH